jgi:hypothetical protein
LFVWYYCYFCYSLFKVIAFLVAHSMLLLFTCLKLLLLTYLCYCSSCCSLLAQCCCCSLLDVVLFAPTFDVFFCSWCYCSCCFVFNVVVTLSTLKMKIQDIKYRIIDMWKLALKTK